MVKVLEYGKDRKFIVECEECKSKLEYTWLDIEVSSLSGEEFIECPECGQPIILNH